MVKIKIEEIEHSGIKELVGFTEDHISFLHLSKEEFNNAEICGSKEQIETVRREYFSQGKAKDHW